MLSGDMLSGLSEIAHDYDLFLVDQWGVLHDGETPYPGALAALAALRDLGKPVIVLSNSARRRDVGIARMDEIGIDRALYDHLVTSGEETWRHLRDRSDPFYRALGRRCLLYSWGDDRGLTQGVDLECVERVEDADFILNAGTNRESLESYEAGLRAAVARDLPMICANPDLVVHRLGKVEICAGTIAERYAELGGFVRWHGKPHPSVYRSSLALMPGIDRRRILAVGDSFRTDIRGANGAGLDSLLVTHGIHREDLCYDDGSPDAARIMHEARLTGAVPTWACGAFTW